MTLPAMSPSTTICAVVTGAVGSITLTGVLSAIASAVAIVVGSLHIYDWFQKRRNK